MGRPKKVVPETPQNTTKVITMNKNSSPDQTLVVGRSKRTIKPNPKYNSQEIMPLGRSHSDSEDEDRDNTEEDEDFEEGAEEDKDSDGEKFIPKRRGRPPKIIPASEPPVATKRIIVRPSGGPSTVIRPATNSIMHKPHILANTTLVMKKRKIDFEEIETGVEKNIKLSPIRVSSRLQHQHPEKENNSTQSDILIRRSTNNSVQQKQVGDGESTFTIVNINEIINKESELILREKKPDVQIAENVVVGQRKFDDSQKSIIQVRRSTPMVSKPTAISHPALVQKQLSKESSSRYIIRLPADDTAVDLGQNRCVLNLTRFGNEIKGYRMPSDRWSYQLKLVKAAPAKPGEKKERYRGDLTNPNAAQAGQEYEVHTIIIRRQPADGEASDLQYDRTVVLKNQMFFIGIDGQPVRFLGAPQLIKSLSELRTLLEIVDEITLSSNVIELLTAQMTS